MKVFDPFGKYLAENSCLQTMFSHSKPVTCLAFHFDLIISGSSDMTVKIWKPDKERKKLNLVPWFTCFKTLNECDAWVSALWASPEELSGDQGEIVVGTMKGTCFVYKTVGELRDRKSITDVKFMYKLKLRDKGITNILMLQGSNMMVSTGFDNEVKFTDYSGKTVFSRFVSDERICGMDWNSEFEELITVAESGKVNVYQYRTGESPVSFHFIKEPSCLSFASGRILVSGRNAVQSFIIERNIPHREHKDHADSIIGISVNPKRTATARLITAGADNKILVWEVSKFDMRCIDQIKCDPKGGKTDLTSFVYIDEGIACSGHDSGLLTLWNLEKGKELFIVQLHENTVCDLFKGTLVTDRKRPSIFSPRGTFDRNQKDKRECVVLVSSSFDGSFGVCDLTKFIYENQQPIFKVKHNAHNREILCVILNQLNGSVITGGNDGTIRFWSIDNDLQQIGEIKAKRKDNDSKGHKHAIVALVLDGHFLYSASDDQTIALWNVLTLEKLITINCSDIILGMRQLEDNDGKLITWYKGGKIDIWQLNAEDSTQNILFTYENKKIDITYLNYDNEKNEIFAGDSSGKILRIKTNYNELNHEADKYVEENFRKDSAVQAEKKKETRPKLMPSATFSSLLVTTTENSSTPNPISKDDTSSSLNNSQQMANANITHPQVSNSNSNSHSPRNTSKFKISINLFDELFGELT
nr:unnamed protein product [Naegleria fowleri]